MSRPTRGQKKQCRPPGLVQCKIAVLWTRNVEHKRKEMELRESKTVLLYHTMEQV